MANSYLRRVEALESIRPTLCERGCAKCYLAGSECDGNPMGLGELLASCGGMPAGIERAETEDDLSDEQLDLAVVRLTEIVNEKEAA